MADVFLSYKRGDAAKVGKLAAALREAGLDVWWDRDIPPGAKWEATIEKALADAKTVIVCWSPHAVASDNVKSEARVARDSGRLIQVFLRPCSPPLFFGEQQGVDLLHWRGKADDPRIAAIAETVRKVAAGERVESVEPARRRLDAKVWAGAAAVMLLLIAVAGWWFLWPAAETGPKTIAVLPFRPLNASDANLVDSIWDDTRGAIGRNPNLRVLGRQTVEALAKQDLQPADYRRKVGADYLLDGSVQHVGDQVQLKLSLVQTKDGSEVWSDQLGGKLDNVFAFQQQIAQEVEGRIRGRLAPGGGTIAKNIATSGDVYALYANARAKIRERRGLRGQAIPMLRRALASDPNFAPAWADLAEATAISQDGDSDADVQRKIAQYLKQALVLAPNFAHAYAVRGSFLKDNPGSESDLRRAVVLDPNDVEAWMWLGNFYGLQNKGVAALRAHSRAVELDPLWFTSMFNKMDDLTRLGDMNGLAAELRRVESTGDERLILLGRQQYAYETGHPGTVAQFLHEFRRKYPDDAHPYDLALTLLQLGFVDEAGRILEWPREVVQTYKGTPPSSNWMRAELDPKSFWEEDDGTDAPASVMGRLLPKSGRLAEYLAYYKAAFRSPDEFYETVNWPGGWFRFCRIAPNAAANLRAGGMASVAEAIVAKNESILAPLLRNGRPDRNLLVVISQLRAVEGRDEEAMRALTSAVRIGWLPNRVYYAADIAEEPSFRRLLNRADFQAVRRNILLRFEKERQLVTPPMLASVSIPAA